MSSLFKYFFLFLALTPLLGGCGIKPSSLQPPSGDKAKPFPSTYPHPDTIEK